MSEEFEEILEELDEALGGEPPLIFQIHIAMDTGTVQALVSGRYTLYCLRAFRCFSPEAHPLVWRSIAQLEAWTHLKWTEQWMAYGSQSDLTPGPPIVGFYGTEIQPGWTVTITPNLTGQISQQGTPGAVTLVNNGAYPLVCGLGTSSPDHFIDPYSAAPVRPGQSQIVTPRLKVLLKFSKETLQPGAVIGPAPDALSGSPGLLVDLSEKLIRQVRYEQNTGWYWEGGDWAQRVPADANLVSVLVEMGER